MAADPLEGKFNGSARAAFDSFKAHTDEIATDINAALSAVLGGISGMDTAFTQGENEMVEATHSAESSSDFDAARFGTSRARGCDSPVSGCSLYLLFTPGVSIYCRE